MDIIKSANALETLRLNQHRGQIPIAKAEDGIIQAEQDARERAVKCLCEIWCEPADLALCEGKCKGINQFLKYYDDERS